MEVQKFNIEFVERTRKLLTEYSGEYKLTNLINCTLGLIILPYEAANRNNFTHWNESVSEVEKEIGFNLIYFEPIKNLRRNRNIEYHPKTFNILLKKIRDCLAHQRIEPINENKQFVGVRMETQSGDLKIEFTRKQLEEFALYICDRYTSDSAPSHQTAETCESIIQVMNAPAEELLSEPEFYLELNKEAGQE